MPMMLTPLQTLMMIIAVAAATAFVRFLPFWLFPDRKKIPAAVTYLSHVLPPAMMGLLVVYCLKDVTLANPPYTLPELLAIGCIVLLHGWKRNVLLSIGVGTAVYMVLIRVLI